MNGPFTSFATVAFTSMASVFIAFKTCAVDILLTCGRPFGAVCLTYHIADMSSPFTGFAASSADVLPPTDGGLVGAENPARVATPLGPPPPRRTTCLLGSLMNDRE